MSPPKKKLVGMQAYDMTKFTVKSVIKITWKLPTCNSSPLKLRIQMYVVCSWKCHHLRNANCKHWRLALIRLHSTWERRIANTEGWPQYASIQPEKGELRTLKAGLNTPPFKLRKANCKHWRLASIRLHSTRERRIANTEGWRQYASIQPEKGELRTLKAGLNTPPFNPRNTEGWPQYASIQPEKGELRTLKAGLITPPFNPRKANCEHWRLALIRLNSTRERRIANTEGWP